MMEISRGFDILHYLFWLPTYRLFMRYHSNTVVVARNFEQEFGRHGVPPDTMPHTSAPQQKA